MNKVREEFKKQVITISKDDFLTVCAEVTHELQETEADVFMMMFSVVIGGKLATKLFDSDKYLKAD